MALYEHIFMARQDIAPSQVEALMEGAQAIIEANSGTVVKSEIWPLRTLAYRIQKNRKAHYVLFNFDGPGAVVAELERQAQINEDIIRYLTVRVDEVADGPTVLMRRNEKIKLSKDQREIRDMREANSAQQDGSAPAPAQPATTPEPTEA